jgi:hypothetical protein
MATFRREQMQHLRHSIIPGETLNQEANKQEGENALSPTR